MPIATRASLIPWAALSCLLGVLGSPIAAAAAECGPAAVLSGDADLVQEASLALRRAGVGLEGTEECPAAEANLRREDGLISVRCSDPVGRSVSRTVATVDEAVSVIESWAQPEANAAWMEGWTVEMMAPPISAKEVEPPGTKEENDSRGAFVSTGWTGDLLWDGDGSTWMGTTLTVCMRVGPFCGGGAAGVRGSTSLGVGEVGALASLELPLRAGRWELSPGIGVGGAKGIRSGSRGSDDHGDDDWRLRGEGRVRVSYSIASWIALDLAFAAEASPAHTSTSTEDKFDDNPHDVVVSDPSFFLRSGAGLRVSIP